MSKVTLNDLSNLQNENTAVTLINGNSSTIETAFDNTLSRDGSSPNQMESELDMNSNRILNLPKPLGISEPLRLQELSDFNDTGAIYALPSGGDTGQILGKTSGADYDVEWITPTTPPVTSGGMYISNTRSDLKAIDTTETTVSFLAEGKRFGVFRWTVGDYSAKVSADTQEGIYIASNSVASSSGAWVRQFKKYVHSDWFGAVGDFDSATVTGTDDTTALQAWLDMSRYNEGNSGYHKAWLDAGNYKITSSLTGRTYISITANSNRWSVIYPVMSSGAALSYDQNVAGKEGSYQQTISNIWINGSNATGTACAMAFGISKNTKIVLCRFTDFSSTTVGALQINGANYALTFELNAFSDNVQHIVADRVTGSGNFPTDCAFFRNTFDSSTNQNVLAAILFRNSSAFIFKNNVLQSNQAKYLVLGFQDSTAETDPNHIIAENWFENNGQTQAGSIDVLLAGYPNANPSLARLATGCIIRDNSFYGNTSITVIEIDDGKNCLVTGNKEPGGAANAAYVATGTYIGSHNVDLRFMASSTTVKGFDANLGGGVITLASGAISTQSTQNITVVRNSAGTFTCTFVKPPKNANYTVNISTENESVGKILSANPYNPLTATFGIIVRDSTNTAVDPRTMWISVKGIG